ncbi:MAG TPA: asparagine synthase (glutamine-hydrolyzing) [Micromonosporaceae bacterium]|nr:asparagine synthase (glutamine-hydrolyzing) [Micromonosporaceae bacterium]
MVGVVAFVAARGDATQRVGALTDALGVLAHRGGPADVVVVPGGAAALGGGPVSYPASGADAGRYLIAFDGEIFNAAELRAELQREYRATFATGSAAEVVVAAYHYRGPSSVSDLRGPYAFVLWDDRARRAFGARDPWGGRPLYHLVTADGLYLASEKKALLPLLRSDSDDDDDDDDDGDAGPIDTARLGQYLTMQYVPEPHTLHRRIARIGAGESFAHTRGGPVANRRFAGHAFAPVQPENPAELYSRIRQALAESVGTAARAGGSVGALLSGGLDSAAIVALAREREPALRAFTVGYDVDGYSEVDLAEATAAELDVPCTRVVVGVGDVIDALPRVVWHLDDPNADPAAVALYLLARRASRDVDAVLSGDGADELFGGYGLYREPVSLAPVSQLPHPLRRGLRTVAQRLPEGMRGRSFLERATTPVEQRYSGSARVFTDAETASLLRRDDLEARATDLTAPVYARAGRLDDVTRMQFVDVYTRLRGDVLVKADRLTMAHGLRLRTPFLDPAVAAVAATIPTELRVPRRSSETKAALRRALIDVVPATVLHRRRAAITSPVAVWLRGDLGDWADDVLAASHGAALLDVELVRGLLAAHRRGDGDHGRKIWTALIFCLWHDIFVSGSRTPQPISP